MKMKFRDTELTFKFSRYQYNARPAIQLINEDGIPFATATVNLPDVEMADDVIAIKNYAENTGILESLIEADIIEEVIDHVVTGYVQVPLCRLTEKAIKELN